MNIIDKLNNIAVEVTKKIDFINLGGCCVFASLIAQHLYPLVPLKIVVFAPTLTKNSIDEVRHSITTNRLCEWNDNGIYFGHVMIELTIDDKTFLYDSNGIAPSDTIIKGYKKLKGELTLLEATELADDSVGWNDTFNRDKIPRLKNIINNFFIPQLTSSTV